MALTKSEVCSRVDNMHLDDLDLVITHNGGGFAVVESHAAGVSDIGSSWEVPDAADEHGRHEFTAGPWTAYQYHASYTAPNRSNYEAALDRLAAGEFAKLLVGVTAIGENDTWVFGIREEA
ncbi:hypothetical protein [Mycolicibacterium sp.]|uniref:hypothetical protein n=1 Tax=Mycolicibacterium sp. TaxID=2320850 RepID=UPI00355ED43A